MSTTQAGIDALSTRIERAYRLRIPQWHGGCSSSRVWGIAASRLNQANQAEPFLPVDPELYVASQPLRSLIADPWTELASPESVDRYRDRIQSIVRGLREELAGEIRIADHRIRSGQPFSRVLGAKSGRISPLARYLVAVTASRERLASRFRERAIAQHVACPLYRLACVGLIPLSDYPVAEGWEPIPLAMEQGLVGNFVLSSVIQN